MHVNYANMLEEIVSQVVSVGAARALLTCSTCPQLLFGLLVVLELWRGGWGWLRMRTQASSMADMASSLTENLVELDNHTTIQDCINHPPSSPQKKKNDYQKSK